MEPTHFADLATGGGTISHQRDERQSYSRPPFRGCESGSESQSSAGDEPTSFTSRETSRTSCGTHSGRFRPAETSRTFFKVATKVDWPILGGGCDSSGCVGAANKKRSRHSRNDKYGRCKARKRFSSRHATMVSARRGLAKSARGAASAKGTDSQPACGGNAPSNIDNSPSNSAAADSSSTASSSLIVAASGSSDSRATPTAVGGATTSYKPSSLARRARATKDGSPLELTKENGTYSRAKHRVYCRLRYDAKRDEINAQAVKYYHDLKIKDPTKAADRAALARERSAKWRAENKERHQENARKAYERLKNDKERLAARNEQVKAKYHADLENSRKKGVIRSANYRARKKALALPVPEASSSTVVVDEDVNLEEERAEAPPAIEPQLLEPVIDPRLLESDSESDENCEPSSDESGDIDSDDSYTWEHLIKVEYLGGRKDQRPHSRQGRKKSDKPRRRSDGRTKWEKYLDRFPSREEALKHHNAYRRARYHSHNGREKDRQKRKQRFQKEPEKVRAQERAARQRYLSRLTKEEKQLREKIKWQRKILKHGREELNRRHREYLGQDGGIRHKIYYLHRLLRHGRDVLNAKQRRYMASLSPEKRAEYARKGRENFIAKHGIAAVRQMRRRYHQSRYPMLRRQKVRRFMVKEEVLVRSLCVADVHYARKRSALRQSRLIFPSIAHQF